jgi:hydroxyacylglutathione hydrolase
MKVTLFPQLNDNYAYILQCEKTGVVALVDCPDAGSMVEHLEKEGLTPSLILNTHHHWDHTGGNEELVQRWPELRVLGYRGDQERIPAVNELLDEGDRISVGEEEAIVLFTPGHTSGHIAYFFEEAKALFCGDTLFVGGCGRFFEGTPADMVESVKKLRDLGDDVKMYCGHEYTLSNLRFARTVDPDNAALQVYQQEAEALRAEGKPTIPSTLGLEKAINPFVRFEQPAIQNAAAAAGADPEDEAAVMGMMREMKNNG